MSGVGETGLMLVRAGYSGSQHCSKRLGSGSNPKSSSALEQRGEREGPGGGEVEAQALLGDTRSAPHRPYVNVIDINIRAVRHSGKSYYPWHQAEWVTAKKPPYAAALRSLKLTRGVERLSLAGPPRARARPPPTRSAIRELSAPRHEPGTRSARGETLTSRQRARRCCGLPHNRRPPEQARRGSSLQRPRLRPLSRGVSQRRGSWRLAPA